MHEATLAAHPGGLHTAGHPLPPPAPGCPALAGDGRIASGVVTPGDDTTSIDPPAEPSGEPSADATPATDPVATEPAATDPAPTDGVAAPTAATGALGRLERLEADRSGGIPRPAGATRLSRWDRPPEPHDWRWAIGWGGRILISIGVLMFAFVGYQLWGTGIQTAQAQNRLSDEFDQLLDTGAPAVTTTLVPTTTEAVETTTPATPDTAPETTEPTPTSSTLPAARMTPPIVGDPLAKLTIPAIDLDKIVIEGVGATELADGPGHFPETPIPGQYGNAAIAGHRTTHGQPFIRIDELQPGDDIVVQTIVGTYTYVVDGQQIVSPDDYALVIPTTDPSVATLTLTSCHPKYSARQRIVVTATLDPDRSDVVTLPFVAPVDDADDTGVIPGDLPGDGDEPADTTPASTAPATTEPATTTTVVAATTTTVAGSSADDEHPAVDDGEDLFANRWFSDPDAFPQVALWGVLLTAVALGATALSRRVRRNWVGALVGIGPFVLVLYFFFENVNRLLPPNL